MEIKVEDYLSQEEITEILRNEIRDMVRSDKERILTNNSYSLGTAYVESLLTDDDKEFVKNTVIEHLSKKDTIKFELFRKPDAWNPKRSPAIDDVIQKTLLENQEILKNKTIESMKNIDIDKLTEYLTENFDNVLMTLLEKVSK